MLAPNAHAHIGGTPSGRRGFPTRIRQRLDRATKRRFGRRREAEREAWRLRRERVLVHAVDRDAAFAGGGEDAGFVGAERERDRDVEAGRRTGDLEARL